MTDTLLTIFCSMFKSVINAYLIFIIFSKNNQPPFLDFPIHIVLYLYLCSSLCMEYCRLLLLCKYTLVPIYPSILSLLATLNSCGSYNSILDFSENNSFRFSICDIMWYLHFVPTLFTKH